LTNPGRDAQTELNIALAGRIAFTPQPESLVPLMVQRTTPNLYQQTTAVSLHINPLPLREMTIENNLSGWGAGWKVTHGRHHEEIMIFMTSEKPGEVYLQVNDHTITIGPYPSVRRRGSSELGRVFNDRLSAAVMSAFEIVVSAPMILSISTAF
jgi:hypothetical protein